jgi:hypothetical protein
MGGWQAKFYRWQQTVDKCPDIGQKNQIKIFNPAIN